MSNQFTTWLIIAYGLSVLGYVARFMEGIPNVGILIGMTIISMAYGFMFISNLYKKKVIYGDKKEDEDHDEANHEEKRKEKVSISKLFTILGYSLASIFFFTIHIIPQLTFTVRYYDIFGAIGYGTSAVGTAFLPVLLPIGYAITTIYYICGSYRKLGESEWIGHIQLISRTILALVYGVTSLSYANLQIF